LDQIIVYAEDDKEKALKAQRDLFCRIGGPEFRLALEAHNKKESNDRREIAYLETEFMHMKSEASSQASDTTAKQGPKAVATKVSEGMITPAPEDVAAQAPADLTSEPLEAMDMQLTWANTQAWVNSLPDFSSYPPEPTEPLADYRPSMVGSQTPAGPIKTTMVPEQHQYTVPQLRLPPTGRNRPYALDPVAEGLVPSAIFAVPNKNLVGMGPTRALGPVMNFSRYKSPFFCQDCGDQFKVEGVGHYEDHRAKCKGKKKDAAVETGDLKDIRLAHGNTVTHGPGAGNAFHVRSMPNLHGTLTNVGLHNGANRLPPLKLPPFKFPASKEPTQADESGSSGSPSKK
jgi:hypothetical protein